MKDFEIRLDDKPGYKKEKAKSIVINIIVTVALSAFVVYESNLRDGIGFAALFFFIQFFKSNRWDKYFISEISVKSGIIEIIYNENGSKKNRKRRCDFFLNSKKIRDK